MMKKEKKAPGLVYLSFQQRTGGAAAATNSEL